MIVTELSNAFNILIYASKLILGATVHQLCLYLQVNFKEV